MLSVWQTRKKKYISSQELACMYLDLNRTYKAYLMKSIDVQDY